METINFTKLPDVTAFEELPEGAQVLIEHEGKIYRVPGAKVGGVSLPTGGTTHQHLAKLSDADGDAGWVDPVQPDWNVNDPGDPAHVKNRTHWVEESETVIVEGTTDASNPNNALDDITAGSPYLYHVGGNSYLPIEKGVTYKYVDENDVAKDVVFAKGSADYLVGTSDEVAVLYFVTSYPAYIGVADNTKQVYAYTSGLFSVNQGSHKLSKVDTTTHPLPPSLGGMPTLASDGSDAGKFVMANTDGTGYELIPVTQEEWTFTMDDDSTVTKKVLVVSE